VIVVICAVVLVAAGALAFATSRGGTDTAPTTVPFVGSTLNVVLGDYVIQGDLTAPAGEIRLQAVNQGGIVHNVGVRGVAISGDMQPGRGYTLDLGVLTPGTYQLYCDIPEHVAKGMVADLVVTEA
jgi:hypothetical protein